LCDPDFNAWTEEVNVISRKDVNLRTAGGHVHIGYENPDAQTNIELIKLMDLFLGVPSILLDTDTERRKMYGKAGCFRFTEFGVEYRVLSNFWTTSLENIKWLFDGIKQAVEAYNNGMRIDSNSDLAKSINSCINNQNEDFAIEICEEFNIKLNNILV